MEDHLRRRLRRMSIDADDDNYVSSANAKRSVKPVELEIDADADELLPIRRRRDMRGSSSSSSSSSSEEDDKKSSVPPPVPSARAKPPPPLNRLEDYHGGTGLARMHAGRTGMLWHENIKLIICSPSSRQYVHREKSRKSGLFPSRISLNVFIRFQIFIQIWAAT